MNKKLISLTTLSLLAACGGGGGESTHASQPVSQASPSPVSQTQVQLPQPSPPAAVLPAPPTQVVSQPIVTPITPPPANTPVIVDEVKDEPSVTQPNNPAFTAKVVRAPISGSYVCSETVLYITGQGIRNAELVHGNSYSSYARFSTSADGSFAVLQFNPRQIWNNGAIKVRILAWDQPAGSPQAQQVEVMPERTWYISNDAAPCTPAIGTIAR